jgi:hypothetical protein
MSSLARIPLISDISKCESIHARQISTPSEGLLHVILEQGGSVPQLNPDDFVDGVISALDLAPKPRRSFELKWNRCIAYVATDETYAPVDRIIDDPTYSGRWFESFDKSRFLRYITETTFAVEHHSLAFEHIRVRTYNWVVDVVSDEPPEVQELTVDYR